MPRHSLRPPSPLSRWGAGALAATLVLAGCGDEADGGSDAAATAWLAELERNVPRA